MIERGLPGLGGRLYRVVAPDIVPDLTRCVGEQPSHRIVVEPPAQSRQTMLCHGLGQGLVHELAAHHATARVVRQGVCRD